MAGNAGNEIFSSGTGSLYIFGADFEDVFEVCGYIGQLPL